VPCGTAGFLTPPAQDRGGGGGGGEAAAAAAAVAAAVAYVRMTQARQPDTDAGPTLAWGTRGLSEQGWCLATRQTPDSLAGVRLLGRCQPPRLESWSAPGVSQRWAGRLQPVSGVGGLRRAASGNTLADPPLPPTARLPLALWNALPPPITGRTGAYPRPVPRHQTQQLYMLLRRAPHFQAATRHLASQSRSGLHVCPLARSRMPARACGYAHTGRGRCVHVLAKVCTSVCWDYAVCMLRVCTGRGRRAGPTPSRRPAAGRTQPAAAPAAPPRPSCPAPPPPPPPARPATPPPPTLRRMGHDYPMSGAVLMCVKTA
jgi:hypothetical protein